MPNYAQREQEMLTGDQLALTVKSRQPAIGQLDDTQLLDLIDDLRAAQMGTETGTASGEPGPAEMLGAAIRRVDLERRKRGLKARKAVDDRTTMPATPRVAPTQLMAVATARRKPATIPRKPAGRKPAEARKTDLRTEPHRVVSRPGKTSAPVSTAAAGANDDTVTRNMKMTLTEAEKAAKQAARKAEKEATKVAEKEAAREARRAERKALKDAEKEQARLERRAARKAEKDAERQAEKQAERAERKAVRQAEAEPVEAAASEAPPVDTSAVDAPKGDKPKAGKGKGTGKKKPK